MNPVDRIIDMISAAVEDKEVLRAARAQRILRRWPEIVGDLLAEKSWPDRYDHGLVWIAVTDAAWAQEMRMIREGLLDRMRQMAGEPSLFTELRFGVRPLKAPKKPEVVEIPEVLEQLHTAGSIREIAEARMKRWKEIQESQKK